MAATGTAPEFVAMDNEPDLWGDTHYDVHPKCPTYEEILAEYLQYAPLVKRRPSGRHDRARPVLLVRLLAASRPDRTTVASPTS